MSTSTELIGPVDYIMIEFPGSRFDEGIVPALLDLVATGTVRIIDLGFVTKDADGTVQAFEVDDFEHAGATFRQISAFLADLIVEEDLEEAGALLEPGSSAVMIVWENTWAAPFATAVRASGGEVIDSGRIPAAALLEALAASES